MKWERKDSDSVTLGSNVTLEHWADVSSPNPIAWLPVLGPHAGKKSSTWAKAIRTAPMLNQPVKGVWPYVRWMYRSVKKETLPPLACICIPKSTASGAAACSGEVRPIWQRGAAGIAFHLAAARIGGAL